MIVKTPYIDFSSACLKNNCQNFIKLFPGAEILFSVKANDNDNVLKLIHNEGLGFDVASQGEIDKVLKYKVDPESIAFSNPTKIPDHISYAYKKGIKRFAFDSKLEVEKLSKLAPMADVYVRLVVSNTGSRWPLENKFGVEIDEAFNLMSYAKSLDLNPVGIAFHVGSQNLDPRTWTVALKKTQKLWKQLVKSRVVSNEYNFINIGGGYPGNYLESVEPLENYAKRIITGVNECFGSDTKLILEPGRSLVSDCGILVSSVINIAVRNNNLWIHLDTGVYNGLQETLEGFRYNIYGENMEGELMKAILTGPTCDSTDIIQKDVLLPKNIKLGDKVFIETVGAYVNSYATYNGYQYPELVIN